MFGGPKDAADRENDGLRLNFDFAEELGVACELVVIEDLAATEPDVYSEIPRCGCQFSGMPTQSSSARRISAGTGDYVPARGDTRIASSPLPTVSAG